MDIPHTALSNIFGSKKTESTDTTSEAQASNVGGDATMDTQTTELASEDTTDVKTKAPVQHEEVHKHHEEEVLKVVDKEKHQDHYHTTIQPLKETEVAPEKHDFKQEATQERTFNNEDAAATKAKLKAEQAKFKNTHTETATAESKTDAGTVVGGEHVHHHHHEIIQPVIEKEIVKNSVTHTKVPIHEVHQEASVVHEATVAEPKSVEEFKKEGNKVKETK